MSADTNSTLFLALNAGSSSLKISLYSDSQSQAHPEPHLSLSCTYSSLSPNAAGSTSSAPASFKSFIASTSSTSKDTLPSITSHDAAFHHFLDFISQQDGVSVNKEDILYVCHRIVHGGTYTDPVVIGEETYEHLDAISDLAPLHNGPALSVLRTVLSVLPNSTSIAFFDTAFHRTIPPYAYTYAIDPEVAKRRGLRKYGFHGLSYSSILRSLSPHLHNGSNTSTPPLATLIALHLGAGSSICAIQHGHSIETTMGLTPVSGLPGATRSGDIDPSLIFHYREKESKEGDDDVEGLSHASLEGKAHLTTAEEILNKKSGWTAMTGVSDFRIVAYKGTQEKGGDGDGDKYTLAYSVFLHRVSLYVGSYIALLGGPSAIDGLVFAGGIGENSEILRRDVMSRFEWAGFGVGGVKEGEEEGKVRKIGEKVWVCETDEQMEMVLQLKEMNILQSKKS